MVSAVLPFVESPLGCDVMIYQHRRHTAIVLQLGSQIELNVAGDAKFTRIKCNEIIAEIQYCAHYFISYSHR